MASLRAQPYWLLILLLAAATACQPAAADPKAGPNVVLVVIDTLRADRLPFYGYRRNTAPFLEQWADRGVVFERAWSPSSWTPPASASIFTSVYPLQHGVVSGLRVFRNQLRQGTDVKIHRIPMQLETIPELLSSLGYRCFAVTDNPNISAAAGYQRGFDRLANFNYEGATKVNEVLRSWLPEIQGGGKTFVYLHYMDPHGPYHEHSPWYQLEGDEDPQSAAYDSEIRYLDEHLREAFEMLGVNEQTVVVITADHGEEFYEHGRNQHMYQLYSELTHVPLLIYHPGMDKSRARIPENVSTVDVLPTLRAILGQPDSSQDEGLSLTRYYSGEDPPAERYLYSQRSRYWKEENGELISVVYGDHKFTLTRPTGQLELYDLNIDFREQNDLATSHSQIVTSLQENWLEFEQQAPRWQQDPVTRTLTAEEVDLLEMLGYADSAEESGAAAKDP
jgi:arylsulfatase A-like enzyme